MKTVLEVSTLMVRQVHVSKAMLAVDTHKLSRICAVHTRFTSRARAMAVAGLSLQEAPFVSFHLVLVSFTLHCSEQYMALYHSDIHTYIYIYIYMLEK
jgi:hypothetical protein